MISDTMEGVWKCLVSSENLHLPHNPLNGVGLMLRVINAPPGAGAGAERSSFFLLSCS